MGMTRNQEWKGLVINNCYIKIEYITGSKDALVLELSYNTIVNGVKEKIFGQNIPFVPNLLSADNFFRQGYLYLNTLPEFANSINDA
jgi:hypothetical protein